MAASGVFLIELAKGDFKFSAAHFTILGEREAELLHGHNYAVSVGLEARSLDALGFVVEFGDVKKIIRALCAQLDERVLIPGDNPFVTGSFEDDPAEIRFADRRYQIPRADVLVLPIRNTTTEAFALYLWQRMADSFSDPRLEALSVGVEESRGQRATFRAPLPRRARIRTRGARTIVSSPSPDL
jgi:6-pyruvoyltetrahydropterin/6-carboxytetrahydropterin synthase